MTGKTHQILGISVGLGYFFATTEPIYSPATLGTVIIGSYFMSLLPDFDTATGKIYKSIPYGRYIGNAFASILEHRNITHSILGLIIAGYGLNWLLSIIPVYWGINTQIVFIPLLLAFISHLIADFITQYGIPVFFPLQKTFGFPPKPFEFLRIDTDEWFENLIIFPVLNLILIGIIYLNFENIKLFLFK